jgi:plasmid maintenance system antidote protein VapI
MAALDEKDIGKDLEQSIRNSVKLQGINNTEITKTLNLLSKINDLRDDALSKIKSLNRETINTKEIEKELRKAKQKDAAANLKLEDLNKKLNDTQKTAAQDYINNITQRLLLEKDLEKARRAGQTILQQSIDAQITSIDQQLLGQENLLGEDERRLAALMQAKQVSEDAVNLINAQYNEEKNLSKEIGITGRLLSLGANKLGIFKNTYGKIVEEARDGEKTTKSWIVGIGAFTVAIYGAAKGMQWVGRQIMNITGANGGGPITTLTSGFSDLIGKIPIVGGMLSAFVTTMANVLDFAVGATSKIQEMGRQVGLTKDQSVLLNNQFSDFAANSGKAYLNSENLFKTYLDISKVLGVNNQISKENLQTQYELNKFLAVDAQTSAEIEKSSVITGKSSKSIAQNIYSQTKNLERATGISFNFQNILKEAASLGGVLGLSFSKYPEKIAKTLLTTKSLGLELKQLDGMADSFLDFESSISKEFEAQLLTGKDINLTKAREAFLNNDLATAAEEITKQVGTSNEFLNMNRIQQEAIAGAMGMSRDQMAEMLKQQEYLSKFGAKDVKDLHEKVRLLRQQGKEQEAINLLGDKEAYNKMVTATASEDLAGFIDKIKQSFADLISNTGLADFVTNTIAWLSKPDNIMKIVNGIKDVFAQIVGVTGAVIGGIMRFLNYFPGINIDESMISMVEGAGAQLKAANLGSLSVGGAAAKDKAGPGSAAVGSSGGAANNYSSAMGNSIPNVSVKIQDRELFVVSYTGYNQGSNSDQQMTTKNISNPTQ